MQLATTEVQQKVIAVSGGNGQPKTDARVIIELDHIHKIYKTGDVEVHALRGVSLKIHEGEFVAIMGTSGSGKSTTMNIIGCLDRPTKGKYVLDGVDVSGLSKDQRADIRNRKLGFVFQGFNLLSRTSAMENVELPMLYANIPTAERHKRAAEALLAVGLGGREQNHPNQLSGGQQQRVAIARSLVNQPALILADEPTGNLDSATGEEIVSLMFELNSVAHTTLLLVTHDERLARRCPRRIGLAAGRLTSDERR